VNFGERGKSSRRHLGSLGFEWGFDQLRQWVDHTCVSTRSMVSLGLVGEFFEVWTQVDHALTIVSRVD
jgi:hypothetical protein